MSPVVVVVDFVVVVVNLVVVVVDLVVDDIEKSIVVLVNVVTVFESKK